MQYFQWSLWILGIALQVLVISSLLRGSYKRFPLILAYCIVTLLGTVVQIAAPTRQVAARYYWYSEQVEQTLIYCIVIVLIYQALSPERRARVGRWLIIGAAAVAIISATVHRDEHLLSLWMTSLSRDLNFTAAVLDLLLWMILIASRRKNRVLLLISGGLGIKFAGAAVGYSLPLLVNSPLVKLVGGIVVVFTYLVCLYVWWEAFRRVKDHSNPAGVTAIV
jgi:hypothetical protein